MTLPGGSDSGPKPALRPWQGRVLNRWTLRSHRASGQIRTDGLPRTEGTLCRWSYEGTILAGRPGLEPGMSPGSKPGGFADSPNGHQEPPAGLEPAPSAYRAAALP